MMYDVCVIGSGAGGGPIAYELSNAGYNVVVLEKGPYIKTDKFSKDELAFRRDIYKPNLKDEFHIIYEKHKGKYVRYDGREYEWSFWNGNIVGGASNFMSGYFHPLKQEDFRLKSEFGEIEGANIEDWPITLDELEPYYKKVESAVGISGDDMPYPPLKENFLTTVFDKACSRLGYKSLRTSRCIISENKGKRNGCYYSNFCGSYGCSSGAKGSSRVALLDECDAKIITESFVYKLESDKNKIKKAYFFDKNKNSHSIEAKIFVLALSPIETSRLLLNSKNNYFPNGIANNSNQVGKNLIFSAGGTGEGTFKKELLGEELFKKINTPGVFFNRNLKDWYFYEEKGKRYKGGVIDFLFEHANIIPRVKSEIWDEDGKIIWGKKLQQKIKEHIPNQRKLKFEIFVDWLPTDGTYVGIEKGVKDKWGIDVASIYLDPHPHDLKVGEYLAKKAVHVLKEMGAVEIYYDISPSPPQNLVAGGARFGDDPKKSVLDKNCKTHELKNLYISDASFMPTGGSVPYTWSIYANSFRVADILKERLKRKQD